MLNLSQTQTFPLYSFSYIFYALKSIVRHCKHENSREKNVQSSYNTETYTEYRTNFYFNFISSEFPQTSAVQLRYL